MSLRRALLWTLPTVLAFQPAQAQQLFEGHTSSASWPQTLAAEGAFARAFALQLDADAVPDVVQLDGGRALAFLAADQTVAPLHLADGVADACRLAGHSSAGREALALVGGGGLRFVQLDPLNALPIALAHAAPELSGARVVRCAEFDTNALPDLAVLAADRRTLHVLASSGAPLSFAPAASFVAVADVRDIVPLQWVAGGACELALLTDAGVSVHSASGALLADYAGALPGGALARLEQQGAATDRLAWVATYSATQQQWLRTLSPAGLDAQLDLGALDVVAAIGADCDLDGDSDLLLSHRRSYELVWLENRRSASQPSVESFALTASLVRLFRVGPEAAEAPENCAWPALADLDGDLDLDVFFACEAQQELKLVRGDWRDEQVLRPRLLGAQFAPLGGALTLSLGAPLAGSGSAQALELEVWRRAGVGANHEGLAVDHVVLELTAGWPAQVGLTLPESTTEFERIYTVRARLVARDAAGVRTASAPALLAGFTLRAAGADELLSDPAAGAGLDVSAPLPEDPGARALIVPSSRTRRFADNDPPRAVQAPGT